MSALSIIIGSKQHFYTFSRDHIGQRVSFRPIFGPHLTGITAGENNRVICRRTSYFFDITRPGCSVISQRSTMGSISSLFYPKDQGAQRLPLLLANPHKLTLQIPILV